MTNAITLTEFATKKLVGRTITKVSYMSLDDANAMCWNNRPLIIHLDDGTMLYSSSDDEGNDGGTLFGDVNNEELTFPVMR